MTPLLRWLSWFPHAVHDPRVCDQPNCDPTFSRALLRFLKGKLLNNFTTHFFEKDGKNTTILPASTHF
jgi:hypothetical protein